MFSFAVLSYLSFYFLLCVLYNFIRRPSGLIQASDEALALPQLREERMK